MTSGKTLEPPQKILQSIADMSRRGLALMAQILFGGLVVLAAGILALATAAIGLILALAAIIIGFASGGRIVPARSGHRDRHASGDAAGEETVTLEAHRTARGWTVE